MENQVSSNWYMVLIKGIIMVLLAMLVLAGPADALVAYSIFIGIGFFIAGIVVIYRGFALKSVNTNWGWTVFGGFLDLVIGYIIMANPLYAAAILPFLIGFWAVVYGIYLFIDAFADKGNMGWKIVGGLLIIILGNIIMFNPLLAGMTFAIWFGIILLVAGIYNIIGSFSLK